MKIKASGKSKSWQTAVETDIEESHYSIPLNKLSQKAKRKVFRKKRTLRSKMTFMTLSYVHIPQKTENYEIQVDQTQKHLAGVLLSLGRPQVASEVYQNAQHNFDNDQESSQNVVQHEVDKCRRFLKQAIKTNRQKSNEVSIKKCKGKNKD